LVRTYTTLKAGVIALYAVKKQKKHDKLENKCLSLPKIKKMETPLTFEQMMALFAQTDKHIRDLFAETDKQRAEMDKRMAEQRAETDKRMAEQRAETDKRIDRMSRKVEGLSDTLGNFAMDSVKPSILRLFKEKGIELKEIFAKSTQTQNAETLYEIDFLAVNGEYAVVVEVKTTLRKDDIEEHLERMKKIQAYPMSNLQDKKIFGAIAAMVASEEVCKYAIKKGFFVLLQSGENMKISNTDTFKPTIWETQKR
jgi:hypothetical protein